MISTFYGNNTLGTAGALLAALLVGIAFGAVLERAGFGSSRKLSGVFYFRDMAVIKVMFTAVITAMLGLNLCLAVGWVDPQQLYFMPTVYGAHIIGGLIFGIGFVMGGWCPGTAAVGVASGKTDALVFLGGVGLGSILFNEIFDLVKPLYMAGDKGVQFVYGTLGMSPAAFALLFTIVGVVAFWACEYIGRRRPGNYFASPFLKAFSLALLVAAGALLILPPARPQPIIGTSEAALLTQLDQGQDHVSPEDLADRLMAGEAMTLVDVRPADEFATFHLRGAMNVQLPDLPTALEPLRGKGTIVLYSNGMTHPAEARDALARLGFPNVYLLTDGLDGFIERCLKPVSLRGEPLSPEQTARIQAWRAFFLGVAAVAPPTPAPPPPAEPPAPKPPTLVENGLANHLVPPQWLADHLKDPNLRVIDARSKSTDYTKLHIPGAIYVNVENLRGTVDGVPNALLPAADLARALSRLGITPSDTVVIYSDALRDATLVSLAFQRCGHASYAVLHGGWDRWLAEKLPADDLLPTVTPTVYLPPANPDTFTASLAEVKAAAADPKTVILDVRPAAYFSGEKSDEPRAGHIPGAKNREFVLDLVPGTQLWQSADLLRKQYADLGITADTPVIVHCRTGHQASQTYFLLSQVLGVKQVKWFDGSWLEWSSHPELPLEKP